MGNNYQLLCFLRDWPQMFRRQRVSWKPSNRTQTVTGDNSAEAHIVHSEQTKSGPYKSAVYLREWSTLTAGTSFCLTTVAFELFSTTGSPLPRLSSLISPVSCLRVDFNDPPTEVQQQLPAEETWRDSRQQQKHVIFSTLCASTVTVSSVSHSFLVLIGSQNRPKERFCHTPSFIKGNET